MSAMPDHRGWSTAALLGAAAALAPIAFTWALASANIFPPFQLVAIAHLFPHAVLGLLAAVGLSHSKLLRGGGAAWLVLALVVALATSFLVGAFESDVRGIYFPARIYLWTTPVVFAAGFAAFGLVRLVQSFVRDRAAAP